LNRINCRASEIGPPNIPNVVDALSRFYKTSLSNGDEVVTLENELLQVQAYVRIQNMRFGDAIDLLVDVPESLLSCRVGKIILQPIVENAILHGILEKEEERGTIRITGREENGDLILQIEDDGVGTDASEVRQMLQGRRSGERRGYGIRNIHERLQLHYGHGYGLVFDSERGKGTTVTLRMPAIRQSAEVGPPLP